MWIDFVRKNASQVAPIQGNTMENDERVSFALLTEATLKDNIETADWSESIVKNSLFENITLRGCSFERVAIVDCDFAGVTFSDCLFRDCLITGLRSRYHLAFENCILDRVMFARSGMDNLEILNSRIVTANFLQVRLNQVSFQHCQPHKRKASVSFQDCDIEKATGLDLLGISEVNVVVDAPMWSDLAERILKDKGIIQLTSETVVNPEILDTVIDELA